jgi:hypothetical protein
MINVDIAVIKGYQNNKKSTFLYVIFVKTKAKCA